MNILAHIYLSGSIDDIMLGNFMGDFVKGKQYNQYNESIRKGILLHRQIDSITDSHISHLQTRNRFREKYGLYSGIVVDILYDHFLAQYWDMYHPEPLELFAQKVYRYIELNDAIFPAKLKTVTPYIIKNNWLELYKSFDGLERVLNGMAKHTSMPNETHFAISILKNDYNAIKSEFENVIALLINFMSRRFNTNEF